MPGIVAIVCSALLGAGLGGGQPVDSLAALKAALAGAKPGDRITLAAGVYEGSVYVERLRGEKDRPIVIAGADPANPPTIRGGGRGGGECIHLIAPAHVVVENLILEGASGNGINVDDGGDLKNPAPGVTLRGLQVREIGPEGNCDGIKLSGLSGFVVEDCTIERWGNGGSGIDMVGCEGGVVRGCTLRHSDTGGASGIQMKGGTRDVVVRSCRFEHAGRRALNIGGSTGLAYFRPQPAGFEARGITVEGCTIVGSEAAVAFVGIDGADVRFNTIYRPSKWVLRILQETRAAGFVPCRGGRFTDNLVVYEKPAMGAPNIGDATEAASFAFTRNVWYCESEPGRGAPPLPSRETDGTYGKDPGLRDAGRGDFVAAPDGPAAKAGAHAMPVAPVAQPAAPSARRLPERVYVKPVFLVPTDAKPPSDEYKRLLMRHIGWARDRYRELLFGRDTFTLAEEELPLVLRGKHDTAYYLNSTAQGAADAVLELFAHDGVDRFSCPFIYVVLFVGTGEWPKGGGTPFNGHVNTGGGVVVLAADNLEKDAGFQSCLQHEIGHAFGLVHADANGFDLRTSDSLMSYNPAHHTSGFTPSATPGRLVPEDLRLLAENRRVFPKFTLDPERDFPPGYSINPRISLLGQMTLPGQAEYTGNWNGRE